MLRFAVFTDLHCDYMFDWEERLAQFVDRMKGVDLDFVMCLGDLCCPVEENRVVKRMLAEIPAPLYYAVGNHDCDHFSQEKVRQFWQLPALHSSFVREGIKFLVLNACYIGKGGEEVPYQRGDYDKERDTYPLVPWWELEWLKKELTEEMPYVLFSHHSLVNNFPGRGIANREEVRALLAGKDVLLCMNGHDHGDDCRVVDGIPYFTLNAMSSAWCGKGLGLPYYDEEMHRRWPALKDLIAYRDPLYAIVEIEGRAVRIYGRESGYQRFAPEDVGMERKWNGISIESRVSDFYFERGRE